MLPGNGEHFFVVQGGDAAVKELGNGGAKTGKGPLSLVRRRFGADPDQRMMTAWTN